MVAERLGVSRPTVGKWRSRFLEHRLDGLVDDPRPGRPATVTAEQVEEIVVATLESTPENATHWSRSKMAERSGLSKSTIGRVWKAFGLKPHRADGFKLSNDPLFVEKVYDIVGLYLDPPESAVVLSVDEKSQVQALSRSQPAFPMMPGMPEKRTHDYFRHGTTSLFAAMNVADGTVIASTHRRHRATEFKKFLTKIDQNVPEHLDVHVVCDNYGTHKHPTVNTWLEKHPRFHMHFTPTYSSWINQVERLFAEVTRDLLQRSDHRSVQALEKDLRGWVKAAASGAVWRSGRSSATTTSTGGSSCSDSPCSSVSKLGRPTDGTTTAYSGVIGRPRRSRPPGRRARTSPRAGPGADRPPARRPARSRTARGRRGGRRPWDGPPC